EKYIFREDFFVKSSLRSSFRSASMVIWTISPTTILPLQARHSNSSYSCVDINIKRGAAWQMCTRVPAQYQSEFVIWSALPVMRNRQLLIRSPLSLIRDRLFLIRVCLPIMWKSLLLIGFGFSPIRQSQLPSGPRKG